MTPQFHMIDVGAKPVTFRLAVAGGEIHVGPEAFARIRDRRLPKGDALMLAEVAGIMGAKNASSLLPLCHPMGLDQVRIVTSLDETRHSVAVVCVASTHARTGVEMEALAGVNAALLTVWDLTKMIQPDLSISNVRLLLKRGGKSGLWIGSHDMPDWVRALGQSQEERALAGVTAWVLTLSDRASRGVYADESGPLIHDQLVAAGADVRGQEVIPDDVATIQNRLRAITEQSPDLVICTGGTGVGPRDVTPEAVHTLFTRQIPGIGELLRSDGATYTPLSWSSRAMGGIINSTLVITLPGSPAAVREGLSALMPALLPHLLKILKGTPA